MSPTSGPRGTLHILIREGAAFPRVHLLLGLTGFPMLLLTPSDPLNPRRPDEHFAPEREAARERGLSVGLVDHDVLTGGDAEAAIGRLPEAADGVYRGWMLRSEQYAALAGALRARGVRLRTSPAAYRRAHELPGWYAAFAEHTPASVWTDGPSLEELVAVSTRLGDGPAVLRDHVKSMKHHWHEAMYVPDLADVDTLVRVAGRFLELRAEDLVGGLVLRRFERFTSAKWRTWWVGARCALVTTHPDDPAPRTFAGDTGFLTSAVAALDSPFLTADVTLRADGRWRVVEVGDGQVSDRPATTPAHDLIAALATA